ncbi:hypothetical protein GCM10025789_13140 [Tessaracoccus lubricantis]|uniref:Uncharacterized protein n=1 Tax=Tessaracoccus lubricantis TaxID=545543 RepID=A0ABP9F8Q4_9ACTN
MPFVVARCSFLAHATLRDRLRGPFVVAGSLRSVRSFLANTQDKRTLARGTLRDRLRGSFVVAWCFLRLIRSFLANTQDKRTLAHGPRSGNDAELSRRPNLRSRPVDARRRRCPRCR